MRREGFVNNHSSEDAHARERASKDHLRSPSYKASNRARYQKCFRGRESHGDEGEEEKQLRHLRGWLPYCSRPH